MPVANEFESSDYFIVTALLASDEQLVAHRRMADGKIMWSFIETPKIAVVLEGYYNGTLVLPLQKVFAAQKLLKNQFKQLNPFNANL